MAFKPNRALLNVNFDGYKLSQDALTCVNQPLGSAVKVARLKEEQFSYQHVRTFTTHNHLAKNPWEDRSVYWYGEDCTIQKATYTASKDLNIQTVYSSNPPKATNNTVNASIVFFNKVLCLFCDGQGLLQVLYTGEDESWKLVDSITLTGLEGQPFMILAARVSEEGHVLHVATIELKDPSHLKRITTNTPSIEAISKWHTIRFSMDVHPDRLNASKFSASTSLLKIGSVNLLATFYSSSVPLFSAFNFTSEAANLLIISEADIKPAQKQSQEVAPEKEASHTESSESEQQDGVVGHQGLGYSEENAAFQWTQSDTDVVVTVWLPSDVTKFDVSCVTERNELVVGLTDGTTYIRGRLHASIDPDASTWTIEHNTLEVTLEKQLPNWQWPCLLEGEEGQKVDNLPSIQSERPVPFSGNGIETKPLEDPPSKRSRPLMQNPLEECDTSDEDATLFVLSEDGTITQRAGLGGRPLVFTSPAKAAAPPYFCLRHDVDAVVWQPKSAGNETTWDHVGTFNALGYVQASKRDRKFTTCSAHLDFAVISDCNKHLFVYMQPPEGLKGTSAVQYVHTLSAASKILGLQVCDHGFIFVLCEKALFLLLVPVIVTV